jgi:hypothetical protein
MKNIESLTKVYEYLKEIKIQGAILQIFVSLSKQKKIKLRRNFNFLKYLMKFDKKGF